MPTVVERARALVTGDDADRLAARREIKKEIARLETLAQRRTAIAQQLKSLDAREEKTISHHEKTCQPIQKALAEIEGEVTRLILADKPVDDVLAKNRADTLGKLSIANSALEVEVEVLKKLRKSIQEELRKLSATDQISQLKGQLRGGQLANPSMLKEMFVATQARSWADNRKRDAERELKSREEELLSRQRQRAEQRIVNSHGQLIEDPEPDELELANEREVQQWHAELAAAKEAWQESCETINRIKKQLENE